MKPLVLIILTFVTFGFLGIAGCSAVDVVTSPDGEENIFSDETQYVPKFLRPILTPILLFIADVVDGTIIHSFVLLIISVVTIVAGFFGFTSPKRRKPSPIPDKILAFLHEHNGSSQKQIIEAVSASRGSTSYHLQNLEQKGYLKVVRANGVAQYFLTSAAPASAEHAAVLRFLSRKKSGAALRMLFEQKEITRKELAGVLHISETTARWYLEQFVVCGLAVSREEEGGVYYCITKEAEDVLHNLIFEEN